MSVAPVILVGSDINQLQLKILVELQSNFAAGKKRPCKDCPDGKTDTWLMTGLLYREGSHRGQLRLTNQPGDRFGARSPGKRAPSVKLDTTETTCHHASYSWTPTYHEAN